jgi:hypothetical protein
MVALIFYVMWVAFTGLGATLAPRFGVSLSLGALFGGTLGIVLALGLRRLWLSWRPSRSCVESSGSLSRSGGSSRVEGSDSPTALWICQRGMASGYHCTDKLTPDGTLAGFEHDDFAPGFRPTYRVGTPVSWSEDVFERLRSAEFARLAGNYADPLIQDGFTLHITWRLDGSEKRVWLANTEHPLLSSLIRDVWSRAPENAGRVYPEGLRQASDR